MLYSILRAILRMWRNWYTRTLEVRVALPCEFESRHPHVKKETLRAMSLFLFLIYYKKRYSQQP